MMSTRRLLLETVNTLKLGSYPRLKGFSSFSFVFFLPLKSKHEILTICSNVAEKRNYIYIIMFHI